MQMTALRVLLLCASITLARVAAAQTDSVDPGLALSYSKQLAVGLLPIAGREAETTSSVLTLGYRFRMLEEGTQQQIRYGVHATDQATWRPYLQQQEAVSDHLQLNLFQKFPLPGRRPQAGLQFERKDVLFEGDQLSIRSISDAQMFARAVGLFETDADGAVLSLLGWRSHMRVGWQLGDPARELQWSFSIGLDRRATVQKGAVGFQLQRRF